jgi:hypothetical protein
VSSKDDLLKKADEKKSLGGEFLDLKNEEVRDIVFLNTFEQIVTTDLTHQQHRAVVGDTTYILTCPTSLNKDEDCLMCDMQNPRFQMFLIVLDLEDGKAKVVRRGRRYFDIITSHFRKFDTLNDRIYAIEGKEEKFGKTTYIELSSESKTEIDNFEGLLKDGAKEVIVKVKGKEYTVKMPNLKTYIPPVATMKQQKELITNEDTKWRN